MLPSMFSDSGHSHSHRRGLFHSPWLRLGVVIVLVFLLIYTYRNYTDAVRLLTQKDAELAQVKQQQDSLSAQLQVVYEHKSRLERSLKEQKDEHNKVKIELEDAAKTAKESLAASETKLENQQQNYANLQKQLNEIKDEKLKADNKQSVELTKAQEDLSNAEKELSDLRKDKEKLDSQVENLQRDLSDAENKLSTCKKSEDKEPLDTHGAEHTIRKKEVETQDEAQMTKLRKSLSTNKTSPAAPIVDRTKSLPGYHQAPAGNNSLTVRPKLADILAGGDLHAREQVPKPKIELPEEKQVLNQPDIGAKDNVDLGDDIPQQRVLVPGNENDEMVDKVNEGQGLRVLKQPQDINNRQHNQDENEEPEERGPPDDTDYKEEDDKAKENA